MDHLKWAAGLLADGCALAGCVCILRAAYLVCLPLGHAALGALLLLLALALARRAGDGR